MASQALRELESGYVVMAAIDLFAQRLYASTRLGAEMRSQSAGDLILTSIRPRALPPPSSRPDRTRMLAFPAAVFPIARGTQER